MGLLDKFRKSEPDRNRIEPPIFVSSFEKCIRDLDEENAKYAEFNDFEKYYLPKIPLDLTLKELKALMKHIPTFTYDSGAFNVDKNEPSHEVKQYRSLQAIPEIYHEKYDLSKLFDNPEIYSYYLVTNEKEFTPQQAFEAMKFFAKERFYTAYDLREGDSYIDNQMIAIFPNENLKNPADYFPARLLSAEDWNQIIAIDSRIKDILPNGTDTLHFSPSYEKCIRDLDEENAKFAVFKDFEKYYLPKIPQDLSFIELKKLMSHIPSSGHQIGSSFIVDENEPSYEVKQYRSLQAIPEIYHEKYDLSKLFDNPEIYSYYLVTNEKEFTPQQAFEAISFFARERMYTTYTLQEEDSNIDNQMVPISPNANLKNPANYFPANFIQTKDWDRLLALYPNVIGFIPASVVKPNEPNETNIKKPITKIPPVTLKKNSTKNKIHK